MLQLFRDLSGLWKGLGAKQGRNEVSEFIQPTWAVGMEPFARDELQIRETSLSVNAAASGTVVDGPTVEEPGIAWLVYGAAISSANAATAVLAYNLGVLFAGASLSHAMAVNPSMVNQTVTGGRTQIGVLFPIPLLLLPGDEMQAFVSNQTAGAVIFRLQVLRRRRPL